MFFFKPLIFLILSAVFGIAAVLGIKRFISLTLAIVFFVSAVSNVLFEVLSSSRVAKGDNTFINDFIESIHRLHEYILNLSALNLFAACLGFFIFTLVFLLLFITNVNPTANLTISVVFFALFLVTLVLTIRRVFKGTDEGRESGATAGIRGYTAQGEINSAQLQEGKYHMMFLKEETQEYRYNEIKEETALNNYRPFVISDRASSTVITSDFVIKPDTSIEQLAGETIRDLDITSAYTQYVINFKAFISKTILKKLVRQLSTDSLSIETMVSLPSYEHYRDYIIQRIKALAESQYLVGHFGDRGDSYRDREWNSEMPSDNQIIMHILGIWLSYFMGHKKPNERIDNQFKMKYLSQSKDPSLGENSNYLLCIEDWSRFYILERGNSGIKRHYAFPGRDSMYSALTIFFYIIKKKANNLLDGADLQDNPICMDRVFQTSRFE